MQTWCKEVGVLVLKGSEGNGVDRCGVREHEQRQRWMIDVFPIRFWEKNGGQIGESASASLMG
jgi:hypothetical protein